MRFTAFLIAPTVSKLLLTPHPLAVIQKTGNHTSISLANSFLNW
jgi:hypothetical protein